MSHLHAWRVIATLSLVGQLVVLGGCVRDSENVHCGGNFWCPQGMTCGADGKSCLPTSCGDGQLQKGEECDPGSLRETAACNSDCTMARCGDGVTNPAAGEACDPGSNRETAACNFDCTPAKCGDGVVNFAAQEECDDRVESAHCNDDCTLSRCGDAKRNQTAGEACDEGEGNSDTGACLESCRVARCGDGQLWSGVEECDEGASSASAKSACPYGQGGCTLCSECRWKALEGPVCGDGVRQENEEACDDGQRNGASACAKGTPTCRICNADCSEVIERTGQVCGDGVRSGDEACDDGTNNNGATACDYGTPTCKRCNANCTALVDREGPFCGDGVINRPGEECDGDRSFVCGTCSATCKRQAASSARGKIRVLSANVTVGDTFAVNDGTQEELFRFVSVPPDPPDGVLPIVVPTPTPGSAHADAELLAQRIADGIAARCEADGGLELSVGVDGSVVTLTNSRAGVNGNQPLGPTREPAAIVFEGLDGGAGCTTGQQCGSDEDCLSGACNKYHVCR